MTRSNIALGKYSQGVENRRINDLARSLGLTTTDNKSAGGHYIVTGLNFDNNFHAALNIAQALIQNSITIATQINTLTSKNSAANNLKILQTNLIVEAEKKLMTVGYYVPQSNDSWASVATLLQKYTGINVTAQILQDLNTLPLDSSFTLGKLIYVPTTAKPVNATPFIITSLQSALPHPIYGYENGTLYALNSHQFDESQSIAADNLYLLRSNGHSIDYRLQESAPTFISSDSSGNVVLNAASFTITSSNTSFLDTVKIGGITTRFDHGIDYVDYVASNILYLQQYYGPTTSTIITIDDVESGKRVTQEIETSDRGILTTDRIVFKGHDIAGSVINGHDDLYGRHYSLYGSRLDVTLGADDLTVSNFVNGDFGVNIEPDMHSSASSIDTQYALLVQMMATFTGNRNSSSSNVALNHNTIIAENPLLLAASHL